MATHLLLKYLKQTASAKEIEEVEDWILSSEENTTFFNKIKSEYIANTFPEHDSIEEVERAYQKFLAKYLTAKPRYKKLPPILRYAAVGLILLGSSFLIYYFSLGETQIEIPENAITLEAENGEIKVIDEKRQDVIYDKSGSVIGKQKGSTLRYDTNTSVTELVYNTLRVPYGKKFQLELSDGTNVHLNSGTIIKYPIKFIDGIAREVTVTGEAFFDVAKDSVSPFLVNADELNIKVLGTKFNVSVYPEDPVSEVVLIEGKVELYSTEEATVTDDLVKSTFLDPNFKGSFDKTLKNITTTKVVTEIYTSWIEGKMIFRNMAFKNILLKLERHYDVDIVNTNIELNEEKFNANFGNHPIGTILEEFRINYGISYEIKEGKVFLR